jgi:hypothetical protein
MCKFRETYGVVRNEVLDIMMELRKREKSEGQENMIAEQNPKKEPKLRKLSF